MVLASRRHIGTSIEVKCVAGKVVGSHDGARETQLSYRLIRGHTPGTHAHRLQPPLDGSTMIACHGV
jgi:hypothetical protein